MRAALREAGIAVRRGDTFPGLGPDHLRVAVPEAPAVEQLTTALAAAWPAVVSGKQRRNTVIRARAERV